MKRRDITLEIKYVLFISELHEPLNDQLKNPQEKFDMNYFSGRPARSFKGLNVFYYGEKESSSGGLQYLEWPMGKIGASPYCQSSTQFSWSIHNSTIAKPFLTFGTMCSFFPTGGNLWLISWFGGCKRMKEKLIFLFQTTFWLFQNPTDLTEKL